jgi:hypothetical protein
MEMGHGRRDKSWYAARYYPSIHLERLISESLFRMVCPNEVIIILHVL